MSNTQLNAQILAPSRWPEWDAFVEADPVGDLLQTSAWGRLKSHSGWKPHVLAVFEDASIAGGGLLLERSLPLGRSLIYAPRGPVLDPSRADVLAAFTQGARDFARGRGGLMVKVDPPWEDADAADSLRKLGYRPVGGAGGFGGVQPRCVMQLDLQRPLDEILTSFHQKWRYNIRLAGRKGVVIRKTDDPNDLDVFYRLYEITARRDGFTGRPRAYFSHMRAALGDRLHVFVGEFEREPVCAALCFHLGDRAWYVYGASADIHREKMPNYLMQWEMISWAHSLGCRWYDFRGVSCTPDDPNDRTAGLNRFKRGFCPRFVKYIGEFDLPLHAPAYWAFTRALPKLQALLKRSHAAVATGD